MIYVATDSKSEGSYNESTLRQEVESVATDSKSEGSYNYTVPPYSMLLIVKIVVVTTSTTLVFSLC